MIYTIISVRLLYKRTTKTVALFFLSPQGGRDVLVSNRDGGVYIFSLTKLGRRATIAASSSWDAVGPSTFVGTVGVSFLEFSFSQNEMKGYWKSECIVFFLGGGGYDFLRDTTRLRTSDPPTKHHTLKFSNNRRFTCVVPSRSVFKFSSF